MTVRTDDDGVILLEGACPIEDAEALLLSLSTSTDTVVDWRGCEAAHTAVVQVLLAASPRLIGPPASDFLAAHVSAMISKS